MRRARQRTARSSASAARLAVEHDRRASRLPARPPVRRALPAARVAHHRQQLAAMRAAGDAAAEGRRAQTARDRRSAPAAASMAREKCRAGERRAAVEPLQACLAASCGSPSAGVDNRSQAFPASGQRFVGDPRQHAGKPGRTFFELHPPVEIRRPAKPPLAQGRYRHQHMR